MGCGASSEFSMQERLIRKRILSAIKCGDNADLLSAQSEALELQQRPEYSIKLMCMPQIKAAKIRCEFKEAMERQLKIQKKLQLAMKSRNKCALLQAKSEARELVHKYPRYMRSMMPRVHNLRLKTRTKLHPRHHRTSSGRWKRTSIRFQHTGRFTKKSYEFRPTLGRTAVTSIGDDVFCESDVSCAQGIFQTDYESF